MRRTLLFILLLVFFCQSFYVAGVMPPVFKEGKNPGEIKEPAVFSDRGNISSTTGFTRIISPNWQSISPENTLREAPAQLSLSSWVATAPGQSRKIFFPIHPEEWGIVVSQLPRSDG